MPWEIIGGIVIAVLVVYAASKAAINNSTISCPNCGERVKSSVLKCRFCGANVRWAKR